MPTPPPWWMLTQDAPEAVLTRAFSSGQSAIASLPSRHRLGLPVRRGHRAAVQVIAAEHDRRLHLAALHQLVEAQAGQVPLAVAEPADPRRQALEVRPSRWPSGSTGPAASFCGNRSRMAASVAAMSAGSPDSAAHRNGPLPSQNSGLM